MKNQLINIYTFEGWEQVDGIWRRFWQSKNKNMIVTQGLNEIQTQFWKGSAYTATLYIGLINDASFGSIALTDVAADIVTSVPGVGDNQWSEYIDYSESLRQALIMGTSTNGSLDNSSSVATFTVDVDFDLNGAFIATTSTPGGTSGKLIGAASAASVQPFTVGQQVRIIISSTLTNA